MAGYSGTPFWKKLGYKDGMTAYVEGAPDNYMANLRLPPDVSVMWNQQLSTGASFVHLFASSQSNLKVKLKSLRKIIEPSGVVWVSWPKKTSGAATDITEDVVRKIALPLGFVDIKVCAVDAVWSGLKLVIRTELR
jgi:hypothetical protein